MKLKSVSIDVNDDKTMTVRMCMDSGKKPKDGMVSEMEHKTVTAESPEKLMAIIKEALSGGAGKVLSNFIGESEDDTMEDEE